MEKRRAKLCAVAIVALLFNYHRLHAQDGAAGIEEADQMVRSYFDVGINLMYAIGAIVGLIGAVKCIVTQEIDDLLASPIIKETIINNSDIKILMDMRKFMHKFDQLQN